jgi:hypothetical protein
MGTSTPSGGGRNGDPLLPSWLEGNDGGGDGQGAPGQDGAPGDQNDQGNPPPPGAEFTHARKMFNRHIRYGDGDGGRTPLQRAVGGYVSKTAGGSRTAAARMVGSRAAASALGGLLFDASNVGIREVVRRLNLDSLASRTLREIYASLIDFVCGDGGETDDAINRTAYLDAIEELLDVPGVDLERPSVDNINLLIERFIAGTIIKRILTAIGNGVAVLPQNVPRTQTVERQLREWVSGKVQDAMVQVGRIFARDQIQATIDRIYERALAILQTFADDQQ